MAKPIESPAGYVVSPKKSSRCSRSIVPTWGARFGGFRNRACSCGLATAAPTMQTEVELQAHQSEGSSRTTPRSLLGPLRSTLVKCLPCQTQPRPVRVETRRDDRHAPLGGSVHLGR